jgi:hypothetical protein
MLTALLNKQQNRHSPSYTGYTALNNLENRGLSAANSVKRWSRDPFKGALPEFVVRN